MSQRFPVHGHGAVLVAFPLTAALLLGGCAATSGSWMHGGETLMQQYRTPSHEIDGKAAGLAPPPMGFRWYRVDRDYVLASRTTGLILKSMPAPQGALPPREAQP